MNSLSPAKRKFLDAMLQWQAPATLAGNRSIERRRDTEAARIGLAQEQVWRRSIRTGDTPPLYNETITVYREGQLDLQILERCFGEILRHREERWLRMTFVAE